MSYHREWHKVHENILYNNVADKPILQIIIFSAINYNQSQ